MKRIISITTILKLFFLTSIAAGNPCNSVIDGKDNITVIYLTTDSFKQLVYNYDNNKEWKYEGTKPAIIDFYAIWCGPCKQLSPIVEDIAREYSGKIIVYKVDTDKERELAQKLGISGLPTLLFIPLKGKPQASMGLISKETLTNVIHQILLIK